MSNRFIYVVQNGPNSTSLYSSDGTTAGTTDLNVAAFGYNADEAPLDFVQFNGRDAFLGFSSAPPSLGFYGGVGITDGTANGTSFTNIGGPNNLFGPTGLGVANGHLLVSGSSPSPDGKDQGPQQLWSSTDGSTFSLIETGVGLGGASIVTSGKVGYFQAAVASGQTVGLWVTDGTATGTHQVFNPMPSQTLGDITSLGGGKAAFAVQAPDLTYSLYVTDGSAAGAHAVTNAALGTNILVGSGSASTGSRAVFSAVDAAGNISAWATDGTGAGTVELVVNGPSGASVRIPGDYIQFGNKVAFDNGYALFVTDGTTKGTVQLPSLESNGLLAVAGGRVFSLEDGGGTTYLVVSDGTVKGTTRIPVAGLQSPNGDLTAAGNGVVFSGTDASGKEAFFTSDGTASGTVESPVPYAPGFQAYVPFFGLPPSAPNTYTIPDGNQLYAAPANTAIQAGNGNDTITATAGRVTVTGNDNGGTILFFGGSAPSSVFGENSGPDTILGGSGGGYYSAQRGIFVSQGASGANTTLGGGSSGTQFFGSAHGNDTMQLGSGSETALGGGGNTVIQAGASRDANDVIFTGAGNTSVTGAPGGYDTIVAGSGDTTVTTTNIGSTGDAIFGGSGSLKVIGDSSAADSIIGGSGSMSVTGAGGNMLVVASSGTSKISTGNGASLIFTDGQTSVTGGSGSLQAVLGAGKASIMEGSGAASYDVVRRAAGGTDMLKGFKVGKDSINLFGYTSADVHVSSGSGNTTLALSDGTKIEVLGVKDLGGSLVV